MENKLLHAKSFIEETGIGRDTFILILSTFETNLDVDSFVMTYKGKNIEFNRQYWMNDVQNKRKFYEDVMDYKIEETKQELIEEDIIESEVEISDLAMLKTIQTLRDKNVKLNKTIRESFRDINKSEETLNEIKSAIVDLNLELQMPKVYDDGISRRAVGLLQISDLHANEIIDEMGNQFDFEILSKRLRKFVYSAITYFKKSNLKKIYILGTGDFINSNRRPSEKVNSATSRVRASFIVVKLFTYIINELMRFGFDVAIACVSSNESRIEEIKEMDDLSASENFDILIYHMLKLLMDDKGVEFIDCNMIDGVINVKEFNRNILITHGTQYGSSDLQKKVQQTKGKYASRGIIIDHIFSGNIHSAYISDNFSRCGSACGGNGFSDSELNFDSRASQNYYVYYSNGAVDGIKIDLQEAENEGWDISNEMKKYHVKRIVR